MEGGYQIIDFKNKPVTGSFTRPELYALVAGTKKPLLLQNVSITLDGTTTEYRDFFSSATLSPDGETFIVGDLMQNITIIFTPGGVLASGSGPIRAAAIPIDATLEVNEDGELGVASNS